MEYADESLALVSKSLRTFGALGPALHLASTILKDLAAMRIPIRMKVTANDLASTFEVAGILMNGPCLIRSLNAL